MFFVLGYGLVECEQEPKPASCPRGERQRRLGQGSSAGRQPHSFIMYCFGLGAASAELNCTDRDLLAREAENFESLILRKPLQASVLDSRVMV